MPEIIATKPDATCKDSQECKVFGFCTKGERECVDKDATECDSLLLCKITGNAEWTSTISEVKRMYIGGLRCYFSAFAKFDQALQMVRKTHCGYKCCNWTSEFCGNMPGGRRTELVELIPGVKGDVMINSSGARGDKNCSKETAARIATVRIINIKAPYKNNNVRRIKRWTKTSRRILKLRFGKPTEINKDKEGETQIWQLGNTRIYTDEGIVSITNTKK